MVGGLGRGDEGYCGVIRVGGWQCVCDGGESDWSSSFLPDSKVKLHGIANVLPFQKFWVSAC